MAMLISCSEAGFPSTGTLVKMCIPSSTWGQDYPKDWKAMSLECQAEELAWTSAGNRFAEGCEMHG